jgi:hypothetical protein
MVGLQPPRHGDDPQTKESIIASLYGEFIGYIKSMGLEDGKEFKGTVQPCFSCSKRYIHVWDMDKSMDKQLVVYLCSTQMNIQFGVADKKQNKTIYKKELNNLRYKISNATDFELIDSHQDKFKEFFEDFKIKFNELFILQKETAEVKG